MATTLVREMLDAGIHFGHRVSRWNPKMQPYIFGKRNLIHIIDIKETLKGVLRAKKFLTRLVGEGRDVLFVGTKRQARNSVEAHAKRCQMHYVTERWLGGTLTNFQTIRSRLARLEQLERLEETGELANYSKKMISTLQREKKKIKRNLEGIRRMNKLPAALVVVDVTHEHIAVREAKKLGIPTVCLIDTDADPDYASIPIPGNDDSMRAIEAITRELSDAVLEGLAGRPEEKPVPEEQAASSEPVRGPRPRPRRTPPSRTAKAAEAAPTAPTDDAAGAAPSAPAETAETPAAAGTDEPKVEPARDSTEAERSVSPSSSTSSTTTDTEAPKDTTVAPDQA